MESMTGSAGQQRVPTNCVSVAEIPLPPLEEQERIVAEIQGYQNEIARLEHQIIEKQNEIQTAIDKVWGTDESV
jgi:type I restriction enzyme S subunit